MFGFLHVPSLVSEISPADRLEPLLLDPTRLRIAATLAAAGEVEFAFVRDRVGVTDSALSKQLRTLSRSKIVACRRERTGARRRLWARLTLHGRAILVKHAQALREIAETPEMT